MHLKTIIIVSTLALLSSTSFSMAETDTPVTIAGIESNEETWFGDSYEEDGCFCE